MLLDCYIARLTTNPLATKASTSALLFGLGDVITQSFFSKEDFDLGRIARMSTIGGCVVGPSLHLWYGALNSVLPGVAVKTVACRLVLDQFVFAPVFVGVFFGSLNVLEGKNFASLSTQLDLHYYDTLVSNWKVWIPAQIVNFAYVPVRFQVLFANSVGLCWNSYLSWVAFEQKHPCVEAGDD